MPEGRQGGPVCRRPEMSLCQACLFFSKRGKKRQTLQGSRFRCSMPVGMENDCFLNHGCPINGYGMFLSDIIILKQAQAPPAVQAPEPQREFERSGLGSALSPAISPGVDGASAANSTATCSITLDSPPTATVTCEPVLLKVSLRVHFLCRNISPQRAVDLLPHVVVGGVAWSFSTAPEKAELISVFVKDRLA